MAPPIEVEALDDDVIISSRRAFTEAKNNSRRTSGRTIVIDVESNERPSRTKRRRIPTNQTIALAPVAPPSPPKEPTFSCPVCMGPMVEETSTKCGHIFCKACIEAAIAAQNKCPTCRGVTTLDDIIRVYLPKST